MAQVGGMMRVLSLFAGIGGFDLGLERTGGFKTVAFAETDSYASKVLAKRFDAPNLGDVTTAEFPDADFICAGFPCQDISYAGAGAGITGSRSGLYGHVVRALRVVRPRGALLENVAALLGRGLDRVLGDMAEIGYDAEWHCIPASAVGAPHRRDRIWIVANPGSEQHEGGSAPLSGSISAELSRANSDAAPVFRSTLKWGEPDGDHAGPGEMADAGSAGLQGPGHVESETGEPATGQSLLGGGRDGWQRGPQSALGGMAHGLSTGLDGHWLSEPAIPRALKGVRNRVDRLRCLGNAVVPQIPELIGRAILEAERLAA